MTLKRYNGLTWDTIAGVQDDEAVTFSCTWKSGFTLMSSVAYKVSSHVYAVRISFTTTDALTANTEKQIFSNFKINGKSPGTNALAGITGATTCPVGAAINAAGSGYINPAYAVAAGKEIRIGGLLIVQ